MVAQLMYCRISGSVVPIGQGNRPISLLAAKLAEDKPLCEKEMIPVVGFRPLLEINSRRVGSTERIYLALRMVLSKDGRGLCRYEFIDRYTSKMTVVNDTVLPIPRGLGSRVGSWKIFVGYAALYEHEIIPRYIRQILDSLPYVTNPENSLSFRVNVEPEEVKANGEWTRRNDADEMANTGRTNPNDI